MWVALIVLAVTVIAGIAAVRGTAADTRDPEFSLGAVMRWSARSDRPSAQPAGTLPSEPRPRSSVDRAAAF
jgi:hypothetical protein